jgi:hypothetical protein
VGCQIDKTRLHGVGVFQLLVGFGQLLNLVLNLFAQQIVALAQALVFCLEFFNVSVVVGHGVIAF